MQDIKNKIEAVLFITGKLMDAEEIAEFAGIGSKGIVKDAIKELQEDYSKRESGLDVYEENGKYKLNLRKAYGHLSMKLASGCEMDPPTQATLAVLAYKQPAFQAEIIKMRGNKAYDHISALKELELITSEKSGRTRILKLTPKFFEYFDLLESEMKEKFNEIGEKYKIEETEEEKVEASSDDEDESPENEEE
ncbi:MAG: SMC-Scp complex subunit ScpB [archaeon]